MMNHQTKIVIMVAMPEEMEPFRRLFPKTQCIRQQKPVLIEAVNEQLYLVTSGIGPVYASLATTLVNELIHPDIIINAGTAGALQPQLAIGDLVLSDNFLFIDDTYQDKFYQPFYSPHSDKSRLFLQLCQRLLTEQCPTWHIHCGTVASTHTFMSQTSLWQSRITTFNILSIDMESAAIAQVASRYQVPVFSIRCLSDSANNHSSEDFAHHLNDSATKSATAVLIIVNTLLA